VKILNAKELLSHIHRHFPREFGLARRLRAAGTVLYHSNTVHDPATGFLEFIPGTPDWIVRAVVRWLA
jgi:hypothetical protein